jgi:hypothetical protein
MRRTALALAVVLVAGLVTTTVTAAPAGAAASIVVVPSTGLVRDQVVQVSGAGFAPDAYLITAECKAGPTSVADCDTRTAKNLYADADGGYAYDFVVKSTLSTTNGDVDCTVADATCAIGVAEANDILGTGVSAPISFAPPAPPQAGELHVPPARAAAGRGLPISATDFAPLSLIDTALCAAAPANPNDCGEAAPYEADASGAFSFGIIVVKTLVTGGGASIDCTVDGACAYAAWDSRAFAASITTAPTLIAPDVAGTFEVTPTEGLRDGQLVSMSGSGWPADLQLGVFECDGPGRHATCFNYQAPTTDENGNLLTQYFVQSASGGTPPVDCVNDSCWIVVRWYLDDFVSFVSVVQPITFDNAPVAVTSHYEPDEADAVAAAAKTLGVLASEEQYLGSWCLAWVLGITQTGTITPFPDSGARFYTTQWQPAEYSALVGFATAHGTTVPEFQKTGALFLAYVLAIS